MSVTVHSRTRGPLDIDHVISYLLQSSRYLLALQQVGWLEVATYWRSLDMQL